MHTELPIPQAFRALQLLAQSSAPRLSRVGPADEITFALTWLAAARMVLKGAVPGAASLDDLAMPEGWQVLGKAGLDWAAVNRVMTEGKTGVAVLAQGVAVVKELVGYVGAQPWDVLPTLTSALMPLRWGDYIANSRVNELMLDMLGEPEQELWIPFDRWGVLSIQALRRGWRVNAAPMLGPQAESTLSLLLAIEFGLPYSPRLDAEVARDLDGRPLTRAAFVLAQPPFGVSVPDTRLTQWESEGGASARFARSETWVVRELLNRVSKKAVFLLPPGVLFTRGQELRLREYLLKSATGHNELSAVVQLPGGALSGTAIPCAVLVATPGQDNSSVLMVDLAQSAQSRRVVGELDELVLANRGIALGLAEDDEKACRVSPADIARTECSFSPPRYLRKAVEVGPHAAPLEGFCEMVRAPALAVRDDVAQERLELGPHEFDSWAPVGTGLEKVARIRNRREIPTLLPGDVVVSIKGSVGKVGLVGDVAPDTVVVSQSCVALRIYPSHRGLVSPEFLLMYLRSEVGQAQLEALKEGAMVQHIGPRSLLESFLLPVPTDAVRAAVEADYQQLCQLEQQVTDIKDQMRAIAGARWGV